MALGSVALADHSLQDAINMSTALGEAVKQTMVDNNLQETEVFCDSRSSNLQKSSNSNSGKDSFKQIALCYDNQDVAGDMLIFGNPDGFAGIPGIVGVLIAEYTWEDVSVADVLTVRYLKF